MPQRMTEIEVERLARMAEAGNWLHDPRALYGRRRIVDDRWPLPVRLLIWAACVLFSFAAWVVLVHLIGATWWSWP